MSIKSILLSLLSGLLFLGIIIGTIFMFKVHFMLGIVGIAAEVAPIFLNRKAISMTNGTIDKAIAKFIIPAIALVGVVFIVLTFTLWI